MSLVSVLGIPLLSLVAGPLPPALAETSSGPSSNQKDEDEEPLNKARLVDTVGERKSVFVEEFTSDVPPNLRIQQYYDIIVEARPKASTHTGCALFLRHP